MFQPRLENLDNIHNFEIYNVDKANKRMNSWALLHKMSSVEVYENVNETAP